MSAFTRHKTSTQEDGGRSPSIRRQLLFLVLAILVPIWLGVGVLSDLSYESGQSEFTDHLMVTARSMSQTADRYFAGQEGALLALATSPSLGRRDLAEFHRQAQTLDDNYRGSDIILADKTGQQLVNSYLDLDQTLGRRNEVNTIRSVFATGKPSMSGIFKGRVTDRYLVSIDVPVVLNGTVAMDLAMTTPVTEIAKLFDRPDLPKGWTATAFDRNGLCLSTNSAVDCMVGHPAATQLYMAAQDAGEGWVDFKSPAVGNMILAFSRSQSTGWTVVLGVPSSTAFINVIRKIYWAVIVGVLGSCFISVLVLAMGRRIAVAISSLVGPALSLGKGKPQISRWSDSFAETAAVRDALNYAAQLYLFREGERDAAERQLAFFRGMMEGAGECIYAFVPDDGGRVIFANDAACRYFGYSRDQMLSLTVADLDSAYSVDDAAKLDRHHSSGAPTAFIRALPQIHSRHRKSDGRIVRIDVTYRSVASGADRIIVVYFSDVESRGDQVLDSAMALSVFNASTEGIMVTDADNRIIEVNPAFTTITGYGLDDVYGKNPSMLGAGMTSPTVYREMWAALRDKGVWQGELQNRSKDGTEYTEWLTISILHDSLGNVHRYIGMFANVSEWKKSQELILRQANYDTLTSLPNRRLFRDRLEHEMKKMDRDRGQLVLMFIDLDRFKEVNDIMGHDAGDELLVEAAKRMTGCVRLSDTVARLGGDEFAIILAGVSVPQLAERIASEIKIAMEAPFTLKNGPAHVSASIGITLYPVDANNAEVLMKNADQAMYAAKNLGRNRFSWFTDTMQNQAEERMSLANDLREAIANGQLQVYFQPIVDLATGRIVKAEALLRWLHPVHGMIPPAKFIPVAEETGQISALGNWVFRESAKMAKEWVDWANAQGNEALARIIKISVNKSPKQFHVASTYEDWVEVMSEIGVDPGHIVIEITENLFLGDQVDMAEKLRRFRDIGMGLSLDDFGTGYSSLGYLKKYEVDYLKMDQSFVRDMLDRPNDRAIAEAILAMAQRLGLDVVAEGIETQAQRDFLFEFGCKYGQGYFFHKPLPIDAFRAIVLSDGADRKDS